MRVWCFNPPWQGTQEGWYDDFQREAAELLARAFAEAMGGIPTDVRRDLTVLTG